MLISSTSCSEEAAVGVSIEALVWRWLSRPCVYDGLDGVGQCRYSREAVGFRCVLVVDVLVVERKTDLAPENKVIPYRPVIGSSLLFLSLVPVALIEIARCLLPICLLSRPQPTFSSSLLLLTYYHDDDDDDVVELRWIFAPFRLGCRRSDRDCQLNSY